MIITPEDIKAHKINKIVIYVGCEYTDKNKKVRDHCHFTRKYRGRTCNK